MHLFERMMASKRLMKIFVYFALNMSFCAFLLGFGTCLVTAEPPLKPLASMIVQFLLIGGFFLWTIINLKCVRELVEPEKQPGKAVLMGSYISVVFMGAVFASFLLSGCLLF